MRQAKVPIIVVVILAGFLASASLAYFVSVEFVGGVPISDFELWAWAEESSLADAEVDKAMRQAVHEQLTSKGYMRVEAKPDFWMTIVVQKDEMMSSGEVRIEALDGATRDVIWRGKIEGYVQTESPSKRAKLGKRAVKKMFKKFPSKS